MSANESFAEVHVHAKCAKFAIQRPDLQIVYNPNEGMRVQQGNAANVPMHVGFDEAANQDYLNVGDQDFAAQWGAKVASNVNKDFGDQTPVGSIMGADEAN